MDDKKDETKDIFPTRRFSVHEKGWPVEQQVIQHDIVPMIREVFGIKDEKPRKPADVIPLKRDRK